jgi:hypothetical protein
MLTFSAKSLHRKCSACLIFGFGAPPETLKFRTSQLQTFSSPLCANSSRSTTTSPCNNRDPFGISFAASDSKSSRIQFIAIRDSKSLLTTSAMSGTQPVALYALKVPPGDVAVPAVPDFAAMVRPSAYIPCSSV